MQPNHCGTMRFQTSGVRIGASSSLELPIECDEPSELHVAWHVTPDGAALDFVAVCDAGLEPETSSHPD